MVAEYMEKNPQVMSYITLRELSSSQEVTEITVLKTCQSLGFDGFNELKYEFRKNSIAKRKTDVLDEKNFYTESIPEYESEDERKFLKEVGESEVQMTAQFWRKSISPIFSGLRGCCLARKRSIFAAEVSRIFWHSVWSPICMDVTAMPA